MRTIRVASRQSALAMTQTKWVISQLQALDSRFTYEIIPTLTKGDKILDVALAKVGGKGLFVSELEQALASAQADFAVHSLKDVPAQLADGLILSAIPKREDARDALISRTAKRLLDLPQGARVGTSSLRRVAQLLAIRPDLQIQTLRGNIDTRLRKLEEENFDAIVLAAAGLHRMGWQSRITEYLSLDVCFPALGQGILGIECRQDDMQLRELLSRLTDVASERAAIAERSLLAALNGGCQVPIGGFAEVLADERIRLYGMVARPDGQRVLRARAIGEDPAAVAQDVARQLREQGADEILAMIGLATP